MHRLAGPGESNLRVCLLASGSKGNAVYVESGETRILVDAGLSGKEIALRLSQIGVDADSLHGILVTHEHQDHVSGVGPLARRHQLPVYIHPDTHKLLPRLGKIDQLREFDIGAAFTIRDLEITPFPVTHDAANTSGFVINTPTGKIGVATDLGIATRLVADYLRDCRVLVLESNHDEQMLQDGPYPWHLKQRIRGNQGHLSNNASAELLGNLVWDGLDAVFLAHLSETNNDPAKARSVSRQLLKKQNYCDPKLVVGSQNIVSECFAIEK